MSTHAAEVYSPLLPLLRKSTSLTSLSVPSATNIGFENLINDLVMQNRLQQLDCDNFNLFGATSINFFASLQANSSLTRLNLCGSLSYRGALEKLSEFLAGNRTLKFLDVSSNRFTQSQASFFASALEQNTTLQTLVLNDATVPDAGWFAIADVLKVNRSLRTFLANDSSRDDLVGRRFVEALQLNTTLTELDGTRFDLSLRDVLTVNHTLATVTLPSVRYRRDEQNDFLSRTRCVLLRSFCCAVSLRGLSCACRC